MIKELKDHGREHRGFIGSKAERRIQHPVNILIIDDDVDSVLQIESVFAHLGCQTTFALSWHDARKKLCALKPDFIILDWVLDQHIDAGEVVLQCTRTFAKFNGEDDARAHYKPKIITYSSLQGSEIELPPTPYFEHLDHWQKPIRQRELLARVLGLLEKVER